MNAELKYLISADIDEYSYWPEEEDNFCFGVQALVGPEGEEIAESFEFIVCTPKWIGTRMIDRNFGDYGVFGWRLIIVKNYDLDKIKNMIAKLCKETHGINWSVIANTLSKYGRWEFDGIE